MKIKVGVIFGGESVEHEVSVISAVQAMNKINLDKYEVIPIYITKDGVWCTGEILKDIDSYRDMDLLKKYTKNVVLIGENGTFQLKLKNGLFNKVVCDIDIIFPIVHGTNVEDGGLQGYLQTVGVPYVGSNYYASVVGQDKAYMKDIFKGADLQITKYIWFYDSDYREDQEGIIKKVSKLKYPVIVKPATTGSSVGIKTASNDKELIEAIDDATSYDNKIIVEEMVSNLKEVNISVLGNYENMRLSEIEEVISADKFLTYEEKYVGNGKVKGKGGFKLPKKGTGSKGMLSASRKIPAEIDKKEREEVEQMALKAFKVLGSSGVCRIDFLIDEKSKKVYINEINSIPGSLAFYLWEPKGMSYTELLDEMITIGIKDYKRRSSKTHSFDSNILANCAINGLKGAKGKLR